MLKRVLSLLVLTTFLFNEMAFALSPQIVSGTSDSPVKAAMYAAGQKAFAIKKGSPGSELVKDIDHALGSIFEGTEPVIDGVKFVKADGNKLPEGWKYNLILQQTDLVKAFKYFQDFEAQIPAEMLDIKEGYFEVDEAKGELPIARIEENNDGTYTLILHTKFVQMWNHIRANDVLFETDLQGTRYDREHKRTVSLAWGIFHRVAKHEMADLCRMGVRKKGGGHLSKFFSKDYDFMRESYPGPEAELSANRIGGRYRTVNDGLWMWFLGSYCFGDTTRYNNKTLGERLDWFFDRKAGHNLYEEFPNLNYVHPADAYIEDALNQNREFATKLALAVNYHFFKDNPAAKVPEFKVSAEYKKEAESRAKNIRNVLPTTGHDPQGRVIPTHDQSGHGDVHTMGNTEIFTNLRSNMIAAAKAGAVDFVHDCAKVIIAQSGEGAKNPISEAFESAVAAKQWEVARLFAKKFAQYLTAEQIARVPPEEEPSTDTPNPQAVEMPKPPVDMATTGPAAYDEKAVRSAIRELNSEIRKEAWDLARASIKELLRLTRNSPEGRELAIPAVAKTLRIVAGKDLFHYTDVFSDQLISLAGKDAIQIIRDIIKSNPVKVARHDKYEGDLNKEGRNEHDAVGRLFKKLGDLRLEYLTSAHPRRPGRPASPGKSPMAALMMVIARSERLRTGSFTMQDYHDEYDRIQKQYEDMDPLAENWRTTARNDLYGKGHKEEASLAHMGLLMRMFVIGKDKKFRYELTEKGRKFIETHMGLQAEMINSYVSPEEKAMLAREKESEARAEYQSEAFDRFEQAVWKDRSEEISRLAGRLHYPLSYKEMDYVIEAIARAHNKRVFSMMGALVKVLTNNFYNCGIEGKTRIMGVLIRYFTWMGGKPFIEHIKTEYSTGRMEKKDAISILSAGLAESAKINSLSYECLYELISIGKREVIPQMMEALKQCVANNDWLNVEIITVEIALVAGNDDITRLNEILEMLSPHTAIPKVAEATSSLETKIKDLSGVVAERKPGRPATPGKSPMDLFCIVINNSPELWNKPFSIEELADAYDKAASKGLVDPRPSEKSYATLRNDLYGMGLKDQLSLERLGIIEKRVNIGKAEFMLSSAGRGLLDDLKALTVKELASPDKRALPAIAKALESAALRITRQNYKWDVVKFLAEKLASLNDKKAIPVLREALNEAVKDQVWHAVRFLALKEISLMDKEVKSDLKRAIVAAARCGQTLPEAKDTATFLVKKLVLLTDEKDAKLLENLIFEIEPCEQDEAVRILTVKLREAVKGTVPVTSISGMQELGLSSALGENPQDLFCIVIKNSPRLWDGPFTLEMLSAAYSKAAAKGLVKEGVSVSTLRNDLYYKGIKDQPPLVSLGLIRRLPKLKKNGPERFKLTDNGKELLKADDKVIKELFKVLCDSDIQKFGRNISISCEPGIIHSTGAIIRRSKAAIQINSPSGQPIDGMTHIIIRILVDFPASTGSVIWCGSDGSETSACMGTSDASVLLSLLKDSKEASWKKWLAAAGPVPEIEKNLEAATKDTWWGSIHTVMTLTQKLIALAGRKAIPAIIKNIGLAVQKRDRDVVRFFAKELISLANEKDTRAIKKAIKTIKPYWNGDAVRDLTVRLGELEAKAAPAAGKRRPGRPREPGKSPMAALMMVIARSDILKSRPFTLKDYAAEYRRIYGLTRDIEELAENWETTARNDLYGEGLNGEPSLVRLGLLTRVDNTTDKEARFELTRNGKMLLGADNAKTIEELFKILCDPQVLEFGRNIVISNDVDRLGIHDVSRMSINIYRANKPLSASMRDGNRISIAVINVAEEGLIGSIEWFEANVRYLGQPYIKPEAATLLKYLKAQSVIWQRWLSEASMKSGAYLPASADSEALNAITELEKAVNSKDAVQIQYWSAQVGSIVGRSAIPALAKAAAATVRNSLWNTAQSIAEQIVSLAGKDDMPALEEAIEAVRPYGAINVVMVLSQKLEELESGPEPVSIKRMPGRPASPGKSPMYALMMVIVRSKKLIKETFTLEDYAEEYARIQKEYKDIDPLAENWQTTARNDLSGDGLKNEPSLYRLGFLRVMWDGQDQRKKRFELTEKGREFIKANMHLQKEMRAYYNWNSEKAEAARKKKEKLRANKISKAMIGLRRVVRRKNWYMVWRFSKKLGELSAIIAVPAMEKALEAAIAAENEFATEGVAEEIDRIKANAKPELVTRGRPRSPGKSPFDAFAKVIARSERLKSTPFTLKEYAEEYTKQQKQHGDLEPLAENWETTARNDLYGEGLKSQPSLLLLGLIKPMDSSVKEPAHFELTPNGRELLKADGKIMAKLFKVLCDPEVMELASKVSIQSNLAGAEIRIGVSHGLMKYVAVSMVKNGPDAYEGCSIKLYRDGSSFNLTIYDADAATLLDALKIDREEWNSLRAEARENSAELTVLPDPVKKASGRPKSPGKSPMAALMMVIARSEKLRSGLSFTLNDYAAEYRRIQKQYKDIDPLAKYWKPTANNDLHGKGHKSEASLANMGFLRRMLVVSEGKEFRYELTEKGRKFIETHMGLQAEMIKNYVSPKETGRLAREKERKARAAYRSKTFDRFKKAVEKDRREAVRYLGDMLRYPLSYKEMDYVIEAIARDNNRRAFPMVNALAKVLENNFYRCGTEGKARIMGVLIRYVTWMEIKPLIEWVKTEYNIGRTEKKDAISILSAGLAESTKNNNLNYECFYELIYTGGREAIPQMMEALKQCVANSDWRNVEVITVEIALVAGNDDITRLNEILEMLRSHTAIPKVFQTVKSLEAKLKDLGDVTAARKPGRPAAPGKSPFDAFMKVIARSDRFKMPFTLKDYADEYTRIQKLYKDIEPLAENWETTARNDLYGEGLKDQPSLVSLGLLERIHAEEGMLFQLTDNGMILLEVKNREVMLEMLKMLADGELREFQPNMKIYYIPDGGARLQIDRPGQPQARINDRVIISISSIGSKMFTGSIEWNVNGTSARQIYIKPEAAALFKELKRDHGNWPAWLAGARAANAASAATAPVTIEQQKPPVHIATEGPIEELNQNIINFTVKYAPDYGPGSEKEKEILAPGIATTENIYKTIGLLAENKIEIFVPSSVGLSEAVQGTLAKIRQRKGESSVVCRLFNDKAHLEGILGAKPEDGVKRIVVVDGYETKHQILSMAEGNPKLFLGVRALNVELPKDYGQMDNQAKSVYQADIVTRAMLVRLLERDGNPFVRALLKDLVKGRLPREVGIDEFIDSFTELDSERKDPYAVLIRLHGCLEHAVNLVEKIGEQLVILRHFIWTAA